jgi:AAA family ATP:ADP antiporter
VFARSAKFSLFDPAKEMVYIEMSKEEKSKGKASVDLLGSQIGKSGASWVTQALLICLGSITRPMPIISATFLGVIAGWLAAVKHLGVQLKEAEDQQAAAKLLKQQQEQQEAERLQQQQEEEQTALQEAVAAADSAVDDVHEPRRWPGSVTDALEDIDEVAHVSSNGAGNSNGNGAASWPTQQDALNLSESQKLRERIVKEAVEVDSLPWLKH